MSLSLIQTIPNAHTEFIWNVKFHPSLPIIASCGSDKTISIWSTSSISSSNYIKKSVLSNTHSRTIRSLNWDVNGNYLAAASMDSLISIWKLTSKTELTFECITTLEGHENEVKSVSWSTSGNYLASCSRDKTIWIWDVDVDTTDFSCNSVLQGHTQDIKMVKWSPREDVLFSGSFDDTIKIWKYDNSQDDWSCINTLTHHRGTVWCIDFNKAGDIFCTCSDDMSVIIFKIDYSKSEPYKNISVIKKIEKISDRVLYACSFSFDENSIVCASGDNSIDVINVNDGTVKRIEEAHEDDVNCVDCNKKEGVVVSCSDDSSLKIWKFDI